MLSSWYISQCRKPSGLAGRLLLRLMGLAHRPFIDWAIEAASPSLSGEILEIGFGSGYGLARLSSLGNAKGIDISAESVRLAARKGFAVQQAAAEAMPFPDKSCDCIISFDSFCYWDLDKALPEASRVLRDGGHLIVALEAADPSSVPGWIRRSQAITVRSPEEIVGILSRHGFSSCRIVRRLGSHAVIEGISVLGSSGGGADADR